MKKIVLNANDTPIRKAYAVAIGVFIGVLPIWGFQVLSAIFSAQYLKLNKPLAVLGSYVNMTPLFPVLVYFCLKVGSYLIGDVDSIPHISEISFSTAKSFLWLYVIGCIPIAFVTSVTFGVLTYATSISIKYFKLSRY